MNNDEMKYYIDKYKEEYRSLCIHRNFNGITLYSIYSESVPHIILVKDGKVCRLSLLNPEYLEGNDLYLSNNDIDELNKLISLKWKDILYSMNREAHFYNANYQDIEISIPNYSVLKGGE